MPSYSPSSIRKIINIFNDGDILMMLNKKFISNNITISTKDWGKFFKNGCNVFSVYRFFTYIWSNRFEGKIPSREKVDSCMFNGKPFREILDLETNTLGFLQINTFSEEEYIDIYKHDMGNRYAQMQIYMHIYELPYSLMIHFMTDSNRMICYTLGRDNAFMEWLEFTIQQNKNKNRFIPENYCWKDYNISNVNIFEFNLKDSKVRISPDILDISFGIEDHCHIDDSNVKNVIRDYNSENDNEDYKPVAKKMIRKESQKESQKDSNLQSEDLKTLNFSLSLVFEKLESLNKRLDSMELKIQAISDKFDN